MIENSKGTIWYGMHFYPGVAEYAEPNKEPYRVFLNEDTIRKMDPTFAGRPVFIMHVDGVDSNIDVLKTEADGWVVESFYNQADGKHWCKFITVSDKADRAIRQQGMRLSNCYVPKTFASGGVWNGVSYAKEITGGEYEHLAIVPNPRYEESVILTPEQFKKYNEDKIVELKRLSNDRKDQGMLKFFKREKVENTIDIEKMSVVLPKSGIEMTISEIVNELDRVRNDPPSLDPGGVAGMKKAFGNDEKEKKKDGVWIGNPATTGGTIKTNEEKDEHKGLADLSHKVKLHDGSYCNVGDLVEKHKMMSEEMEKKKKDATESESEIDMKKESVDVEGDDKSKDNRKDEKEMSKHETTGVENEESEDEKAKKKALELAAHEEKEIKAKNAKEKADRLRNAPYENKEPVYVELSMDRVARGVARYGSK